MKKLMEEILTDKSARNMAQTDALSLAVEEVGDPWQSIA